MYFFLAKGEDLDAFIDLGMQMRMRYVPDGPDQIACVMTMAMCLWRKQRNQQLNSTRGMIAEIDPNSGAYDENVALNGVLEILKEAAQETDVERAMLFVSPHVRHHLTDRRPRSRYKTTRAWIKALYREVQKVLLPAASRFADPPKQILLTRAATFLTHDNLCRELEYERMLDAEFDRAEARLFRLKVDQRKIDYWERRRDFYFWRSLRTGDDNDDKKD
jgi:hypothetical protein